MFYKNITVFLSILSLSFAEEILRCSNHDFSLIDGEGKNLTLDKSDIYFKYNRSNLAVYRYPKTTSVNLLLSHTEASFKVLINNKIIDLNNEDPFELVGVANIANPMNYDEGLKDCVFFGADVKTGRIISDHFSQVISQCFASQLCKSFGAIGDADFFRSAAVPKNFGPLSVSSPNVRRISDRITPSDPIEQDLKEKYEDSIDVIIKKTARSFRHHSNGTIDIDDVKYTVIHAFQGVFEGVDNIYRSGVLDINESYTEQMIDFSFEFGIPHGYLTFSHLRTWGILPFIGVLCADVDAMTFRANVSMAFTEKSCQAVMTGIEMSNPGYQKTFFCEPHTVLTKLWTKWYVNNNNAFVPSIFKDISRKIEKNMARQIIDHFECENFRLSKYHFV